jgi:two-component system LytT family response regulator
MRIHRSHVINLERIQKILKQDGGTVIMDNGDELSISSDKKSVLLEKFDSFRF